MEYSRTSDQPIIERALSRDRDALEELLLARYDWLRSVARQAMPERLREGPAGVEDVLQDAFVRILRGFANFTPQGGEAGLFQWLKTIVQNTARDAVRQQHRSKEVMLADAPPGRYADADVSELIAELAVDNQSASLDAQKKELIRAFRIALSSLDPTYQEVIDLLYFRHHSVEQAAQAMQTTPAAVRGYRGRARDKIRAALIRLSNFV